MHKFVKTLVISALVSAGTVSSANAMQESNNNQPLQQGVVQSQNFDDKTLKKFTEAMQAVGQVANKYEIQMQQEQKPEKVQTIQKEAQDEMVAEIEKSGLSVDKYTLIARAVQTDMKLRERVLKMVESSEES